MSAPAILNSAGNCFAVVDGFEGEWPDDPAACAREICGGAEPLHGLLLVGPPGSGGDARMRVYNADGSRAEMCGNGLRCATKLLWERGHVRAEEIVIETDAGLRRAWPRISEEVVSAARIEIGLAEVLSLRELLEVDGRLVELSRVSVGNPHAVIFLDSVGRAPVATLGSAIERHPRFPGGTNVQFAAPQGRVLALRSWERGVGETPACGTGAAAAAVAAIQLSLAVSPVWVECPGGTLEVEWVQWGPVLQTGAVGEGRGGERAALARKPKRDEGEGGLRVMEVRLAHALSPDEAVARLASAAEGHGLELERESPLAGRLSKPTPFGAVRGTYRVDDEAVVVVVEERPVFLPEGAVRRAVEDVLSRALAPS